MDRKQEDQTPTPKLPGSELHATSLQDTRQHQPGSEKVHVHVVVPREHVVQEPKRSKENRDVELLREHSSEGYLKLCDARLPAEDAETRKTLLRYTTCFDGAALRALGSRTVSSPSRRHPPRPQPRALR